MTEHLLKNYNFEKDVYISNIKLKALVDSGNICYYQNIPVTFINKKYFSNDFLKIGELLTTCLTSEVLVDIYIGPNIVIDKKEQVTYYAFVDLKEYDVIINLEIGGMK